MFLLEAIEQIETLNSDATIWIENSKSWSPQSAVFIAEENEDGAPHENISSSYEYFLEVFTASEFIVGLGNKSKDAIAERVMQYAIDDA